MARTIAGITCEYHNSYWSSRSVIDKTIHEMTIQGRQRDNRGVTNSAFRMENAHMQFFPFVPSIRMRVDTSIRKSMNDVRWSSNCSLL